MTGLPPEIISTVLPFCCDCEPLPSFWTVELETTVAGQPFPEFWVMGPRLDEMFHEFEDLLFLVAEVGRR